MPIYRSHKAFREAVLREANDPAKDPAYVLSLYAENPRLLKRAAAAFHNVSVEAFDKLNTSQASSLNPAITRVLREVAAGLQEERAQ